MVHTSPHSGELTSNTLFWHNHILLFVFVAAEAGVDEQLARLVLLFFLMTALVEVASEKTHSVVLLTGLAVSLFGVGVLIYVEREDCV